MKKSFILYQDYEQHIDLLTDEQAGKLLKAIFKFNAGNVPELDPVVQMAFSFIKSNLERDNGKYASIIERNKNNGLKGGRPKIPETQNNPNNPVGFLGTQNNPEEPKKADTDTDTETDTGTDTQKPTFQKDTYPSKKDAFEEMKADQIYIEECLRSLTYRGWKSANDLTVQILLRYFLHTKADIENTRKDMKRHFKNWLNVTQLKNLQEIK